jgi:hypothetical protein
MSRDPGSPPDGTSTADTEAVSEAELEALAHGRRDLVSGQTKRRLEEDDALAARVAEETRESESASVALKRAMPDLPDLDGMVARAMSMAPPREHAVDAGARDVGAPSGKSLLGGFATGGLVALGTGWMSMVAQSGARGLAHETWGDVSSGARLAVTLTTSLDRLLQHVPGGWATAAIAGLALASLLLVPLRALAGARRPGAGSVVGSTLAIVIALGGIGTAHAYEIEGAWPAEDPRVSVDVDRLPLSEALRRGLVPAGIGLAYTLEQDPIVTLHATDVPLRDVLDALLGDVPARVRHTGRMIVVRPGVPPADPAASSVSEPGSSPDPALAVAPAPIPPPSVPRPAAIPAPTPAGAPPELPRPSGELRDLVSFGGDAQLMAGQQVRDVITMGGDADLRGEVFGNVLTMGGDADVRGVVVGDVVTMGGDIRVARGGRVHGQMNAMGGDIEVEDRDAQPPSSVRTAGTSRNGGGASAHDRDHDDDEQSWLESTLEGAMRHALLFLLGLVFLGVAPVRMRQLGGAIAKQPLRSLASGFLGVIASAVIALVLVITIIGIPGALVLVLAIFLASYLGLATAASVVGAALPIPALADRPVLQLGAGVLVLFLVSCVPVIGTLLVIAATLTGLGAALLTRLGQRPVGSIPEPIATDVGPW